MQHPVLCSYTPFFGGGEGDFLYDPSPLLLLFFFSLFLSRTTTSQPTLLFPEKKENKEEYHQESHLSLASMEMGGEGGGGRRKGKRPGKNERKKQGCKGPRNHSEPLALVSCNVRFLCPIEQRHTRTRTNNTWTF